MVAAEVLLVILAAVAAIVLLIFTMMYLIVPIFKGIGWLVKHLFTFVAGMVTDVARLIGSVFLAIFYVPMVLANVVIGRFSAGGHYGRALMSELGGAGLAVYRLGVGHPLRLLCLGGLVEGFERRLPAVMANAPTRDVPAGGRAGLFEGYTIVGSLAPGGSGAKLYIAQPDAARLAGYARHGQDHVGQVVLKVFSLKEGSSLPQIVRESRSLDAAKKLGLILDHELTPERFYYVMRYVPGEPLGVMTKSLHAGSAAGGLGDAQLRSALGYVSDLVSTLSVYHRGGLWHKDVKPDNLIIDAAGRAHLVDFGLVSSLRSAMTLTTHGTEYFRDPEMVRLALKGVKVHEVDGTRFDLYGAGAVLYSVIEDSFPAHGVLSPVSKRCPEAVKWIIRRAMTDYDKRYASAAAMLADLDAVRLSNDPYAVKPGMLPSMGVGAASEPIEEMPRARVQPASDPMMASPGVMAGGLAGAGAMPAMAAAAMGAGVGGVRAGSPRIRVTNWWSGRCEVDGSPAGGFDARQVAAQAQQAADAVRRSAAEQIAAAQGRVEDMRRRARERADERAGAFAQVTYGAAGSPKVRSWSSGRIGCGRTKQMNAGVGVAVLVVALGFVGLYAARRALSDRSLNLQDTGLVLDEARVEAVTPAPSAAGRVLVVADVLQPWSDAVTTRIGAVVRGLEETGLRVRGNLPATMGPSADESDVELTASARLALGQTPVDSPDAPGVMHEWLRGRAGEADAVLWVAPGQSPEHPPRVHVFLLAAQNEDDRARERAVLWAAGAEQVVAPVTGLSGR